TLHMSALNSATCTPPIPHPTNTYTNPARSTRKGEDWPAPHNVFHEHELLRFFALRRGALQRPQPLPPIKTQTIDDPENLLRTTEKSIIPHQARSASDP